MKILMTQRLRGQFRHSDLAQTLVNRVKAVDLQNETGQLPAMRYNGEDRLIENQLNIVEKRRRRSEDCELLEIILPAEHETVNDP